MFRVPPIRAFRKRLATVAIWAMVPVALWNGRANGGCICADGHYEPLCKAALCSGNKAGTDSSASEMRCCGCSCCGKPGTSRANADCCRTQTGCCRGSDRPVSDPIGESVDSNGCCTPLAPTQAPPAVVTAPLQGGHQESPVLLVAILDSPSLVAGVRAAARVEIDAGLPPTDLVVTLRRLVI